MKLSLIKTPIETLEGPATHTALVTDTGSVVAETNGDDSVLVEIARRVSVHGDLLTSLRRLVLAWVKAPLDIGTFSGDERLAAMSEATELVNEISELNLKTNKG